MQEKNRESEFYLRGQYQVLRNRASSFIEKLCNCILSKPDILILNTNLYRIF